MIQSMIFAFIVLLVAHSLLAGDDQAAKVGEGRPDPLELIPLVTSDNILEKIQEDAKVIFVDARETAEYSEDHIPGALNLTLRQVTETSAQRLGDADLIVTFA
jgi:Rhodanese-like domain